MLYVARHGQTIWNAQNKVCGITDVELTALGREQAKALVVAVAGRNIDVIFLSHISTQMGNL